MLWLWVLSQAMAESFPILSNFLGVAITHRVAFAPLLSLPPLILLSLCFVAAIFPSRLRLGAPLLLLTVSVVHCPRPPHASLCLPSNLSLLRPMLDCPVLANLPFFLCFFASLSC